MVTPLRDGMNLVAKEFVAAQPDDDPGVLVLSQFAGAAHELTEALIVNPFDPDAIADAMHAALTMPLAERRERHAALKAKVFRTTAQRLLPALPRRAAGAGHRRAAASGLLRRSRTAVCSAARPVAVCSRSCDRQTLGGLDRYQKSFDAVGVERSARSTRASSLRLMACAINMRSNGSLVMAGKSAGELGHALPKWPAAIEPCWLRCSDDIAERQAPPRQLAEPIFGG